jgi:hypothetical protein
MMDAIFNVILLAGMMAIGGVVFVAVMMFVLGATGFIDD